MGWYLTQLVTSLYIVDIYRAHSMLLACMAGTGVCTWCGYSTHAKISTLQYLYPYLRHWHPHKYGYRSGYPHPWVYLCHSLDKTLPHYHGSWGAWNQVLRIAVTTTLVVSQSSILGVTTQYGQNECTTGVLQKNDGHFISPMCRRVVSQKMGIKS